MLFRILGGWSPLFYLSNKKYDRFLSGTDHENKQHDKSDLNIIKEAKSIIIVLKRLAKFP